MNTDLMFSSKTDMWATPQAFFDKLNEEFHFDLDVCATPENAKCAVFHRSRRRIDPRLGKSLAYMNPPYQKYITCKWVKKAYEASLAGATVVCLLPARTDTAFFHDYCFKSKDIRFIRGRLKFGDAKNAAPSLL